METKLWARKCSITGKGMNEGWVIGGGDYYISDEEDCKKWLRENWNQTIEEAYKDSKDNGGDEFYWTEWEDSRYFEYIEIDGKLYELSDLDSDYLYHIDDAIRRYNNLNGQKTTSEFDNSIS